MMIVTCVNKHNQWESDFTLVKSNPNYNSTT